MDAWLAFLCMDDPEVIEQLTADKEQLAADNQQLLARIAQLGGSFSTILTILPTIFSHPKRRSPALHENGVLLLI